MQYNQLLSLALVAAYEAGNSIINIYNSDIDFNVQLKADNSPLTIADKKSNEVITNKLQNKSDFFNQSMISKEIFTIACAGTCCAVASVACAVVEGGVG